MFVVAELEPQQPDPLPHKPPLTLAQGIGPEFSKRSTLVFTGGVIPRRIEAIYCR
jgi:hypothetical protein